MKKTIIILSLLLGSYNSLSAEDDKLPLRDESLGMEERLDDLISRLTLEEKVSQMMNATPAIERLGIPPYDWWNEALHGVARAERATVFPQAIALAATFDEKAVYETFDIISDEARAKYHDYQRKGEYDRYKGLTFWTPNVNIFRDPRWGRGMETYGEDPHLTSRMGVAAVKGLQGDDPKYFKSHACAKHYAVHSGPEWNRHEFNTQFSPRDLRETYLPAFEALVKEGNVREVMCAYNRLDGAPCCGSKYLLNSILRDEWGYDGIVVSDCGAIDDFWVKGRHESHPSKEAASVDAIRSGTDLECGQSYQSILEALKNGQIAEQEIDISLHRLLRGRMELGMFDEDKHIPWSGLPYSIVDSKKHKEKALEMARKSMVLLKNSGNVLPLSKTVRKIAVVGPNAADSVMLWANYNGFPSKTVTILEGIKAEFPKSRIIYEKGCELTQEHIIEQFSDAVSYNGKQGFLAKYYSNTKLEGKPVQEEITQTLRYTTTGNTQFAANVPLTNFSASYLGDFKSPITGTVTFSVTADDGYRLYINNELAFDDWSAHSATTKRVALDVKKGETYKIHVDYFQGGGDGELAIEIGQRKQIDFSKTIAKIKDADVIVFVGGLSPFLEGEEMPVDIEGFRQGDRTMIELPAVQKRLLEQLKKINKPLITVYCTGSALALNWENENADAIINAWYGGQAAGTAVAETLSGKYNPAGRLPVSFYTSIEHIGDFEDYSMKNKTYRYTTKDVLYPFGYGLSYSEFVYEKADLSNTVIKTGQAVDLNIKLTNKSKYAGDEVIQVYIKNKADKDGPIKSLRAFRRVQVPARSTSDIKIPLPAKAFETYYDDTQRMEVRPGEYIIYVGKSSDEKDLQVLSCILE